MSAPTKQGPDSHKALAEGAAGKAPSANLGQVETAATVPLLQILARSEEYIESGRVRPVAEAVDRLRGERSSARRPLSSVR